MPQGMEGGLLSRVLLEACRLRQMVLQRHLPQTDESSLLSVEPIVNTNTETVISSLSQMCLIPNCATQSSAYQRRLIFLIRPGCLLSRCACQGSIVFPLSLLGVNRD